jgi:phenylpropionate dioxygenase-like ring-hydroxylating dioxygenase large terminal subunit
MNRFGEFSPTFDIGLGATQVDVDIMEIGRVPSMVYTSQERFDEERELFGRMWLNVARVEEVAKPNDWVVREIHCRSTSVLIVRGRDGKLNAFHNICAHRGMKLVWDVKGNGTFTCPYHAWSYASDGALKVIPDAGCFPHVDRASSGLRPIKLDIWEGFIFINLDANSTQTLEEFLGPLADRLGGAPFQEFSYCVSMSEMLDTNWKLAHEAQSESSRRELL